MRRRIDLGAGLVSHPRVLLLDEPTTGLDPANRIDLWAYLRELVEEGASILLTTQYLEEADQLAGQIVVVDHGQVIESGTPLDLKRRLAGDVLDVTVANADALANARRAVEGLGDGTPTIDRATNRLSVPAHDGATTLVEAVRRLDDAGVRLVDLVLRRPSLDDVFLTLTGHAATVNGETRETEEVVQ